MSKKDKLKRGDWAVHAYFGIGKVTRNKKVIVNDKQKIYFNMTFYNDNNLQQKFKLLEENVRPLATKDEFEEAKLIFKVPPKRYSENPIKFRKNILKEIERGTVFAEARVIRDLNDQKVSGEMDYWSESKLIKTKNLFLTEWSLAVKEDKHILENQLKKILCN